MTDNYNNRVLIFNDAVSKTNGANADLVLGQSDFVTGSVNTGGISAKTLNGPQLISFDSATSTLWVADGGNQRVLAYSALSPNAVKLGRFEAKEGSGETDGRWITGLGITAWMSILGIWYIRRHDRVIADRLTTQIEEQPEQ